MNDLEIDTPVIIYIFALGIVYITAIPDGYPALRRVECNTIRTSTGAIYDMGGREPSILRDGKEFHRLIQREWLAETIDGIPYPERTVRRIDGRKGRIDILIEEAGDFVSIVEIKCSDWDAMNPENVVRNVRRQIRQIWGYIDAELAFRGSMYVRA